jgi:homoserine kinase type II
MTLLAGADHAVLEAWHLGLIRRVETPATGAINRVLLLTTDAGKYVLRAYRHRERYPVEVEHALIAYAAARGIPAVQPIPLPHGGTIHELEGRFYSLFPRAPGYQLRRNTLDTSAIATMGQFQALLHQSLRDLPHDAVAQRVFDIDPVKTIAGIDRLLDTIRTRPVPTDIDRIAIERLRSRRAWLQNAAPHHLSLMDDIEKQVIHGDYQETNLFFDANGISAIIDWDQAYVAPRAWEVVRTLHLVFMFDLAPCRLFLQAYRAVQPLDFDELDRCAHAYGLMRAHDLWLYHAYYYENNERVRQFISPGQFTPLTETWDRLADHFR